MKRDATQSRLRRLTIAIVSRCLATFIALSFISTLLPAGAVAAKSIMECCKGQSAGHCHAGFKPKRSTAVANRCHSDCCSAATAAPQQKRERVIAQPAAKLVVPFVVVRQTTTIASLLSAAGEWNHHSPRGPPSRFIEQIN
jgi:hypothetical protein